MGRIEQHGRCLFLVPSLVLFIFLCTNPALAQFTFSPPALLNNNGTTDSAIDWMVQLATNGTGNWVAIWSSSEKLGGTAGNDPDIFVSRSTDAGSSWSGPELLNSNATLDSGSDSLPAIATDGAGIWVVVWKSSENFGGTAGIDDDIFVSRSTDNGATWTPLALLNTNATTDSGRDQFLDIATDGAGNWVVVWQSEEDLGGMAGTDEDIFVARSTDAGSTWSAPVLLHSNGNTDVGSDTIPKVATDGLGNWVSVWLSNENLGGTAGTNFHIFTCRSTDAGVTWSAPVLFAKSVDITSRPAIATDGSGNWIVVWESRDTLGGTAGFDLDILFARSTDAGDTWSAHALLNTSGTTDISTASDTRPTIRTDGGGNWVAVWDSMVNLGGTGTDLDMFVSRSADTGATWSATALLNSNGKTDTRSDFGSAIMSDGAGNWVVAWVSLENLGGTAGLDHDIFVSTAMLAPLLPAAGGWMLGVLALAILGIGWKFFRCATTS